MNINFYPTISGDLVTLRPLMAQDAYALHEINDKAIWKFMLSKVFNLEEMIDWVDIPLRWRDEKKAIPFVVVENETGNVIGTTRIYDINQPNRSCEIGSTWYHHMYRRTGVNTECKYLLLRHCFEELHMIRVQIRTDERNEKAQKAIERLGAVKEGVLRNERILSDGYIRNAVLYSILDSEWPLVQQQLQACMEQYPYTN